MSWAVPRNAAPSFLAARERFPFDVNREIRGFPRAGKSDSVAPTTTAGVLDGEGILEGPAGAGGLDGRGWRERAGGSARAQDRCLDGDPLGRALDNDRQRRGQAWHRP